MVLCIQIHHVSRDLSSAIEHDCIMPEKGKREHYMKRILFVLDNCFPFGTAAASRARSLCQLFDLAGYKVHVICSRTMESNLNVDKVYKLPYCTYKISTNKPATAIASFVGTPALMKDVKKYFAEERPDFVFAMNSLTFFRKLRRICKQRKIKLIVEQNEWRDKSSFKFRELDYRYIHEEWLIKQEYKKADGILAISRYFQNYYRNVGMNVVRIPTVLDVQNTSYSVHSKNRKIVLIYSGNPSTSKEYLASVINVLADYPQFREAFEFHIYGPDYNKVLKNIGGNDNLLKSAEGCVFIHGKVKQELMQDIMMSADFQIFLRPHRRSSEAGFPTKLGESMAVGTPVITNLTGDIGLYLEDGANGFLADDMSSSSIKDVFDKILSTDERKYSEMRKEARRTAEKCFDFRCYCDEIKTILGLEEKHEV